MRSCLASLSLVLSGEEESCHVVVSVTGLPCYKPQTLKSTSVRGEERKFAAPPCCGHLAERRPES